MFDEAVGLGSDEAGVKETISISDEEEEEAELPPLLRLEGFVADEEVEGVRLETDEEDVEDESACCALLSAASPACPTTGGDRFPFSFVLPLEPVAIGVLVDFDPNIPPPKKEDPFFFFLSSSFSFLLLSRLSSHP